MLKIALILAFIAASAFGANLPEGLLPHLDGRIVGGTAAKISSFPWQVSLQRSGSHSCGGSIYSNNIIVTAAHCVQGANVANLRIRAGSSLWNVGGVVVPVAASRVHEAYNPSTIENDIAVLRLSSSLTYSATIRAIPLAASAPAQDAAAVVTGWGTTASGGSLPANLQQVNLRIVREAACRSGQYGYGSAIKPSMICAYAVGKDSCQGDSGGPLVSGGNLVGVVSWGYGCAQPNFPGVYSCVARLRSWVVAAAQSI